MKPQLHRLFIKAPQLQLSSQLFLRLLGLIYLVAFLSLYVQINGLVGPEGILPLENQLRYAERELGQPAAWFRLPTLFWWIGSNRLALELCALFGALLSLLLLFAKQQRGVLIALFILYLSLYHAGQIFTNFQWDTLLLESGFLAIFLVGGPSWLLLFLFEWLLFRLRFMSGLFKLFSGDPSWAGFTALNHYFETQPLPHIGAWYAHQLPDWLLKGGVGLTLFSELIVPFFIFLPRPFRLAAAAITILMQLLIIATSNHNFINLLTILLCLFLLDDDLIKRVLPRWFVPTSQSTSPNRGIIHKVSVAIAALLIFPASLFGFYANLAKEPIAAPLQRYHDQVRSFGIGNIYHVFPTMQRERIELVIQGSHDGNRWKDYRFRYKPDEVSRAPVFVMPNQPRLDWMIWFVPTQQPIQMQWFGIFMQSVQRGSAAVTKLLAENPFPQQPPRYLRVSAYRYRFSSPEDLARTGAWWQREYIGEFPRVPPRVP